jgi:uncharacterized membrane protein YgcG
MKNIYILLLIFLVILGPLVLADVIIRVVLHDPGISIFMYIFIIFALTAFYKYSMLPAIKYFSDVVCPNCKSKKIAPISANVVSSRQNMVVAQKLEASATDFTCRCVDCGTEFKINKKAPLAVKFYGGFSSGKKRRGANFGGGSSGGAGAGGRW